MGDDDVFYEDEKDTKKKVSTDVLVICNIMRTEDGREYMWKKLQYSNVFESIFNEDPIQHAYMAGKREFGVQLNRELRQAAPDDYVRMIKENL